MLAVVVVVCGGDGDAVEVRREAGLLSNVSELAIAVVTIEMVVGRIDWLGLERDRGARCRRAVCR